MGIGQIWNLKKKGGFFTALKDHWASKLPFKIVENAWPTHSEQKATDLTSATVAKFSTQGCSVFFVHYYFAAF